MIDAMSGMMDSRKRDAKLEYKSRKVGPTKERSGQEARTTFLMTARVEIDGTDIGIDGQDHWLLHSPASVFAVSVVLVTGWRERTGISSSEPESS